MADRFTRDMSSQRVATIVTRSPLDHPRLRDQLVRTPCLAFRDDTGGHRLIALEGRQMSIGRSDDADVVIDWDRTVSRFHATLELTPDGWAITDDGRSLNGTLVNGHRIQGTMLLRDRDLVQVGETALGFRTMG